MTSLADLRKDRVMKALLLGAPGTMKTGSFAAVVNSGRYRVRLIMLDPAGEAPLLEWVKPEHEGNLDIIKLCEDLRIEPGFTFPGTASRPRVADQVLRLIQTGKIVDPAGVETDWGLPSTWLPDDVLALDGLSKLNPAIVMRLLHLNAKAGQALQGPEWFSAQSVEQAILSMFLSPAINCNVMVIAHTKLVGPPEPAPAKEDRDPELAAWKTEIKRVKANFIDWKMCPAAIGKELSMNVAGLFPMVLYYETDVVGSSVRR